MKNTKEITIEELKPIIKWAGGKSQLLKYIVPMLPQKYNHYFEPFLGGAAVYLYLKPQNAHLNDFNDQLMNLYSQIQKHPKIILKRLEEHKANHEANPEEYYYASRDKFNECLKKKSHTTTSAALFIYLNKAGFNGLYRLNASGGFNVPSGKRKTVYLCDKENLYAVGELLKNAVLTTGDFEVACADAKKGDFVFFDSPYYNTFDSYQAGGFSEDEHRRLAKLFTKLSKKGVYCMLTNSNEDFIKELYKEYNIKTVDVKRMINSDASKRTGKEVIITNYR